MANQTLHIKTPYKKSQSLSDNAKLNAYVKLENIQPSGSFKIRGVGNLCRKSVVPGMVKFVCSSGGNAGLAAAYAASELGKPIEIYTPESTPKFVVRKLENNGAKVVIAGTAWDECNKCAVAEAAKPGCVYVPPFDHPDIWEGNATIIEEIKDDVMQSKGRVEKPDVIVVSVGGGGLLCGIVEGLKKVRWDDIPVVAVETEGASSLHQSVKKGHLITLPEITSIAKSLGAKTVAKAAFEATQNHKVVSCVVSDRDAVGGIVRFLGAYMTVELKHLTNGTKNMQAEERMLVEPACSATLAVMYNGKLRELIQNGVLPATTRNIALIVCGGSVINLELLEKWRKQFSC